MQVFTILQLFNILTIINFLNKSYTTMTHYCLLTPLHEIGDSFHQNFSHNYYYQISNYSFPQAHSSHFLGFTYCLIIRSIQHIFYSFFLISNFLYLQLFHLFICLIDQLQQVFVSFSHNLNYLHFTGLKKKSFIAFVGFSIL